MWILKLGCRELTLEFKQQNKQGTGTQIPEARMPTFTTNEIKQSPTTRDSDNSTGNVSMK